MKEEIKKVLNYQLKDLQEYKEALNKKGMFESVETVSYIITVTKDLLDNPQKIDWILNN